MSSLRLPSMILAIVLAAAGPAVASDWTVSADGPETLDEVLATAEDGDTVRVRGGTWPGPVEIRTSIRLEGEGWPVIDGGGHGTVVRILAPDVTVRGFVVRGSGSSLDEENSGVAVEASGATVEGNRLEDILFGIYLRQASGGRIAGNEIRGKDLDTPRRGDAIRVWYSDDTRIVDNRVTDSRDVVLWYSSDLDVSGNEVTGGRYGLHFMYCDDARIAGNRLADNSVGAFLMYSRRLRLVENAVTGNHGPSGYGIGLKDMDDAVVARNLFVGNRVGAFLDNSPREIGSTTVFDSNLIAANDLGVRLLPNVRRSSFLDNGFVENQEQVAIAGGGGAPESNTWRGNHWSDYRGYDADGDGVGDVPYRSQRLFESLADRHPELRLFGMSPAQEALDFAARAFPLVRPRPKLVDPSPRMSATVPTGPPGLGSEGGPWMLLGALGLVLSSLVLVSIPGRLVPGLARSSSALPAPVPRDSPPAPTPVTTPTHESAPEARRSPIISAAGLGKRFGDVVALADVSFEVGAGQSVALWGANGAGKTTALRALLGVLPHDGDVRVGGHDPQTDGRAARRLVGFVPQETAFPDLTTEETLVLFARLRRAPLDQVPELLERLGLEGEEDKRVRELSGGRKQRLALAAALLGDPPILLLDEPTSNLDVGARREFLAFLGDLRADDKTVVFTSHRPDEVRSLADRVVHLTAGRVEAEGTPEEVLGGEGMVEIRLVVPRKSIDAATEHLDASGLGPERIGKALVIRVPSHRRGEVVTDLVRAGIPLDDLDVESLHD